MSEFRVLSRDFVKTAVKLGVAKNDGINSSVEFL